MTLEERLKLYAQRAAAQFKAIAPRLLPTGGTVGQILEKSGAADGAAGWATRRYDFALPVAGKPAAGERLMDFEASVAFAIAANLAGTRASARTAASASAAFSLRKNGTEFATITFAANATTGTLAGSATTFAVGDVFELIAPATADAALSDIRFTIAATR